MLKCMKNTSPDIVYVCLLYLIIHSEKFTGNAILIYGFIYVTEVLDPDRPKVCRND